MSVDIQAIILKVLQLLLILCAGIYACKKAIIPQSAVNSLSKLLSNITNPLLIICSFQIGFDAKILTTGLSIIVGAVIIHIVSSVIAYFVFRPQKGSSANAPYEFAAIFSNCGFMGFPILGALFGDIGIVYGAFYNAIFNLWLWTYGIVLLNRHKNNYGIDIKKLLFNPGVIATIVGFLLFIFRISIPATLFGAMDMVGDTTFPLSMLVIGCISARIKPKSLFGDFKLYVCSCLKLIVFPLLTAFVCSLLGVETGILSPVLIILCAMPAATFTAIFAEIYGVNPEITTKIVSVTTVLSVITIPAVIYLSNLIL